VALLSLPQPPLRPKLFPIIGVVTLLLVLSVSALFVRLAVRTEQVIAGGGLPSAGPVATFQIPEVEECYREYCRVPGFEDKKSSMQTFLKKNGVRAPFNP
jgi:hypothetical protein